LSRRRDHHARSPGVADRWHSHRRGGGYTLSFVGHTHTYEHFNGSREVVVGNGGAPVTGNKNYGFAIAQQRSDNAIQVDMLDYATRATDTSFRFAVKPDGTPAP